VGGTVLERVSANESGKPKFASKKTKKRKEQLDLFSSVNDSVASEILSIDTDSLTPEDALTKIIELKTKIKK